MSRIFQVRSCTEKEFKKYQRRGAPCINYELGWCCGPCANQITKADYQVLVQQIVDFLEGRVSHVTGRMMSLRDTYSEELAFEKAQAIQEKLLELLRLQASTQYLAKAVHQNHVLLILPDKHPGRKLILYVYKGRPVYKQVFDPETDHVESILERIKTLQAMLQAPMEGKQEVIEQAEREEIRIIAQWLHKNGQDDAEVTILSLTEDYQKLAKQLYAYFSGESDMSYLNKPQATAELVF